MNYPSVDKHILGSMKRLFLKPNLTILNDKEKSNLQCIDECSANDELSFLMSSHEGGHEQQPIARWK